MKNRGTEKHKAPLFSFDCPTSSITPKAFNFNGNTFTTITDERTGRPWFVAKEICDLLELKPWHVKERLDDDEKSYLGRTELGLNPGKPLIIVNKYGLFSLILSSRKPQAKAFKRWVTHEVLPAIEETGGYIHTAEEESDAEIMAKALMVAQKTIERKDQMLAQERAT